MTAQPPDVCMSLVSWRAQTGQHRRHFRIVTCLVMGLLIAGCASEAELKPAPSSRFVKAKTVETPATQKSQVIAKAAPVPVKPRVYPEPNILEGLSATKVEALLGAPGFKRTDEPAEIWQYRAANCTLDLFMYEMLDSEQRSVAHYETRPRQGQTLSAKDCFIAIIQNTEAMSQKS